MAGVAQRRRNRRSRAAAVDEDDDAIQQFQGASAPPTPLEDEDDCGEDDGQAPGASRRQWLRVGSTALRRSSRAAMNRAREEGRKLVEGGNGLGRRRGVSRTRLEGSGGLEGARQRRVAPGWLGGIPPSSLGVRVGEEDPRAPGGPGGLAGPAPPGRQVSLSLLFSV